MKILNEKHKNGVQLSMYFLQNVFIPDNLSDNFLLSENIIDKSSFRVLFIKFLIKSLIMLVTGFKMEAAHKVKTLNKCFKVISKTYFFSVDYFFKNINK